MEQKCEALCEELAQRVVDRNFGGVHSLFAPWLQEKMTPADIERLVDEAGEGQSPARDWTLDEGFLEVDDLGGAVEEITGENYRGWLCVQFNPGSDTPSFDLWFAAVEHDGNYRIGHLEPAESD